MPVRRTATTPSARPPMEVNGHTLDGDALAELGKRAREDGKVFSLSSIAEKAAALGDGDRFLTRSELERAYATIAPSRLPAQQSEPSTPSVRSALHRAWSAFKDQLEGHAAAAVPEGFGRVIVETSGGVASPTETFVSAYVDTRSLKRLRKTNDLYFERKQFGAPSQVFGPFSIDSVGISTNDVPPALVDDGAAVAALLKKLPSQKQLLAAHARGEALRKETFSYDSTTDVDVEIYLEVSKRQAARLTDAQNKELETLAAYKSFGSQTPAVNDWLRGSPRGRNLACTLLDQAFERAVELPKGLLMFRGIAADKVQGKRGELIVDPAYLSASLDPGTARMFADNAGARGGHKVLLMIEAGERSRGLFSGNKGETEVVLPRSQKLRVVSQHREAGYLLYHLKMD